jgi:hypothetical protein
MRSRRWSVIVAHRRAGKTVAVTVHLVLAALRNTLIRPRYAYIAPFYAQAKSVAWDYLLHYARKIPGTTVNRSELWVQLPNEARIRLFGADNPDSLRGQYWDGVVLDEVAQMRPEVWGEVVRPALTDRQGWAVFIGTPKGQNLFFDLYNQALKDDRWYVGFFPADRTGAIPEAELAEAKNGMSDDQFRQEFLCDFTAANPDSILPFDLVRQASGRSLARSAYQDAPLVFGLDVARFGDDRSVLIVRQGLAVTQLTRWRDQDLMALAGAAVDWMDRHRPEAVFVDAVGLGAGVVDRLRQIGRIVIPVQSGGRPADPVRFTNLRAEMWWRMKEWLELGAAIPDDPELRADLLAPTYDYDPQNRIRLERKEDMKKRGLASPDTADALALTFALPVIRRSADRPRRANLEYDPFPREDL